jgi:hypothetical protein
MPPLVSEGALSSLSHRNPRACKRGAWRRRRARERPLQSVHLTRRCVGRSCGFSPSPSFRHPPFRTPTRNAQPDECVYAVSIDECAACGAYSIAPNRYRILLGGLCTLTSPFANGEPRGNRLTNAIHRIKSTFGSRVPTLSRPQVYNLSTLIRSVRPAYLNLNLCRVGARAPGGARRGRRPGAAGPARASDIRIHSSDDSMWLACGTKPGRMRHTCRDLYSTRSLKVLPTKTQQGRSGGGRLLWTPCGCAHVVSPGLTLTQSESLRVLSYPDTLCLTHTLQPMWCIYGACSDLPSPTL